MRIAIYSGQIPSSTFIELLIKNVAKKGHEVLLFGSKISKVTYDKNIRVYSTPSGRVALSIFVLFNWIFLFLKNYTHAVKLLKHVKANSQGNIIVFIRNSAKYLPVVRNLPDIFHLQWAKSAEQWLFLKLLFNVRLIVSFRGAHINYSPLADKKLADLYRRSFPHYNGFHAVSEKIAREALKYNSVMERTRVVKGAVDNMLLKFPLNALKKNHHLEVVSVGRFHWKKGYHYALDAMKILKRSGFKFHYTIIAGNPSEEIEYQIQDNDISAFVTILPNMQHQEVLKKIQYSDLLLLPSVEEGIANVVLEAMALGTLVLSTNCGGMDEVVLNGINGFIVNVRRPEEMAKSVLHINELNRKSRLNILQAARETIEMAHLVEKQSEDMILLYQDVYKGFQNN